MKKRDGLWLVLISWLSLASGALVGAVLTMERFGIENWWDAGKHVLMVRASDSWTRRLYHDKPSCQVGMTQALQAGDVVYAFCTPATGDYHPSQWPWPDDNYGV